MRGVTPLLLLAVLLSAAAPVLADDARQRVKEASSPATAPEDLDYYATDQDARVRHTYFPSGRHRRM